MPKHKERSPDEWYKSEIRSLRKQVKSLQKQLKQYEKIAHMFEGSQDEELALDSEDTYPDRKRCPECTRGILETIDIVGRIFETCAICKYRKKLK